MLQKPDFICIGPTRTGTTWLYEALRRHPQVWLPPMKELRYLSEGISAPIYSYRQLLTSRHWHYAALRRLPLSMLIRVLTGRETLGSLPWALHYALRPGARAFDLAWYARLFENSGRLVSGDVSPMYYHLPEARIAEFARFRPNTSVLIFVRNPIERVWSMALKTLGRQGKRAYAEITNTEFQAHFEHVFKNWTPYEETIGLWRRYFPQVYVGRFDDLKERPKALFADLCVFLGIAGDAPGAQLEKQVNKGIGRKLPGELAQYLRVQYADEIKRLAELGYCKDPDAWLNVSDE